MLDGAQAALEDDVGTYVRTQDRLDVQGTPVWHLWYRSGDHSYSWVDDGVIVEAYGADGDQLRAFVDAYITARAAAR